MCKGPDTRRLILLALTCILAAACGASRGSGECVFNAAPDETLLQGRLLLLEIVDAETGEVASFDARGDPVFDGGQPLTLWAEFEEATPVEVCVLEQQGNGRPLHLSKVTFSEEIDMQPLGIYDIGSYLLHLSMDGTLVATIRFEVR